MLNDATSTTLYRALDGLAMRVPIPTGSMTDLTVVLKKEATKEEVKMESFSSIESIISAELRKRKSKIIFLRNKIK